MSAFRLSILLLLISFIGFGDATYLAIKHYKGEVPPCSIISGCEVVTTSTYATIFGVSVALLGSLYYTSVLLLSILYIDIKNERIIKTAAWLTPLGFVATLYFLYLQFFVLKAVCIYCMVSAGTSTLLFIVGLVTLKKLKQPMAIEPNSPVA